MSWWRNCFERLASDRRVRLATRKKALVGSMLRKLDLVEDVNGDLLYLYLSPVISDELILMTTAQHDRMRTSDKTGDAEWYDKYLDYTLKSVTENDRSESLLNLDIQIGSFLEATKLDEETSLELFNRIIDLSQLIWEIHHSTAGVVGGTVVALDATAVVLSSIYNLVSGHVSRVFPFRKTYCAKPL